MKQSRRSRNKKPIGPSNETAAAASGPIKVDIGFNQMGKRTVMDIEVRISFSFVGVRIDLNDTQECPIATRVINEAYGPLRQNILE